jgi:hypothetical protein
MYWNRLQLQQSKYEPAGTRQQAKKNRLDRRFSYNPGGEGGIRTRGGMLSHTRFPGVRLKPLIHLSGKARILPELASASKSFLVGGQFGALRATPLLRLI